ncbi:nuclear transcription factor Y subunit B-6-like [Lotus japonicus]|uniref:nuclear transcription factor Y subunit B-6-like n=1 Tax=Lotus japonicus TaxID=34305 RepID=UPI00258779DF|nr:nuclear transcription factor Y subunit B-6-like [Lotus japonicus]
MAGLMREQDQYMPIANVIRIMRRTLPPQAKISDEAKETIQECVSEFISFVTSEANERCQKEQRKTVSAEDVLWAFGKLGFDDYLLPLTLFLHRYRHTEGGLVMPPPPPLPQPAPGYYYRDDDASASGSSIAPFDSLFHLKRDPDDLI